MKAFNWVLTGLLIGLIVWLLVTLILGVIYQPEYSNDINITVNCSSKLMVGSETVEITRQVPVIYPFSGETKVSEVKTVIKTTKPESSDRRVVIAQETFKETMRQVAYKAHKEAQNEYDKSFSTLLTILTIFGIAWPVIIAMLQFKFNETIQNAAQKSLKQSEDAIKNLIVFQKELYHLAAENYLLNACFWGRESKIGKQQNNQRMEINGIRCSVRAYIKTIYYYAKADELENANHYVRITTDLLDKLQENTNVKKTQKISDIDWEQFLNFKINHAKEIKEKAEFIFCKD